MPVSKALKRVCLTPQVSGVGGMVTFQAKLKAELTARGIHVTHSPDDEAIDAVLVVGGTRQLVALRRIRRRGLPVVQRLDGINWLHRKLRTGVRHWLRAEIGNWLLAYTRDRIATRIVYQSQFVQDWWQRRYGAGPQNARVIHNGVDLDLFRPNGEQPSGERVRILMVEGSLQGGYEIGIHSAVRLAESLRSQNRDVELIVAGQINDDLRSKWTQQAKANIRWAGVIQNDQLPNLYRKANLFFSGDLNAACPNSVIEAMACGLPVLAFDTGALKELVAADAGRIVAYGGDPWKLEAPNISNLVEGAESILDNQTEFRAGARARSEAQFGLDHMLDAYIEAMSG
jgi:glycosyltransferase involved in cell wall biosynthesis